MTPASKLSARERRLIRQFRGRQLAVAGDLIADEFIYGQIDRVSREAPVLILRYDSTEIVPGGAGNAANNAAALGARVAVVGVVGRDEAGRRLDARCLSGMRLHAVSFGRRATSRPSRPAFSPAACTRPSSRSCASTAPACAA